MPIFQSSRMLGYPIFNIWQAMQPHKPPKIRFQMTGVGGVPRKPHFKSLARNFKVGLFQTHRS
jgi:hypothetical protein